jgi:hypothetical protein
MTIGEKKGIRMIEVTGINLVEFVQEVYNLSVPLGLGHLHYTDSDLSVDEAMLIIRQSEDYQTAVAMDYVNGRACKMEVFKEDDKLYVRTPWHNHTDKQLEDLLGKFGIDVTEKSRHSPACCCIGCKAINN